MKTSFVVAWIFAALLLLAVPTSAGRSLRHKGPSKSQVKKSIDRWSLDVIHVNNFLNKAASLKHPASDAATTKQIALNEPVQLGILSSVPGLSDAGKKAVQNLQKVFSNVPNDLQKIVNDPSAGNVQTQLFSINTVRCHHVLPDLAILWPAAAKAVGLSLAEVPAVSRPDACP